jgi:hypothetical protein
MATLYVADQLHHPPPPNPPLGDGEIHPVTSAPAASFGNDGDLALNTTTGDLYVKANGTWALQAGGGGGGDNNQSGSGSPVGVKTPDYVGQGYTDTDSPFHQWFAIGLTNADWFEVV